jgi:N-acetylglucosaminyl-diphospho-decaprenol L-rhamnosyltransferase
VASTRVDLVVVHRSQPSRALETVRRFLDQDVPVRVAVVDNGSSADARARLREGLPSEVVLLTQSNNLGFGPAANAGFRWFGDQADRADWLAVAPHDAQPAPGCLRTLLAEMVRRPTAGLASADVGDGLTPMVDRYFGAIPTRARVKQGWEPSGYPHGTLLVARRACLDEVGLFDERYFAYCEEADLALRARWAGWQVGVVRGAEVRNPTISSHVAVVDYLQLRNTLLLVREHFGRYALAVRTVLALGQLVAGLADPSRRGPYWDVPARLCALRDHYLGRFGPPPPGIVRRDERHQRPAPPDGG